MSRRTIESIPGQRRLSVEAFAEMDLLYEHAPVGLALLDSELRYVRVNEILATWRGIAQSEFAGRPLQGIVARWHEGVAEKFQCTLYAGKPVLNIELTAVRHSALCRAVLFGPS